MNSDQELQIPRCARDDKAKNRLSVSVELCGEKCARTGMSAPHKQLQIPRCARDDKAKKRLSVSVELCGAKKRADRNVRCHTSNCGSLLRS
jgi:hypothetical protein